MALTPPLASVAAVALGLLTVVPDCAYACSCVSLGSQQEIAEQALSDSAAVFSGEVLDVEKEAATETAHSGSPSGSLRCGRARARDLEGEDGERWGGPGMVLHLWSVMSEVRVLQPPVRLEQPVEHLPGFLALVAATAEEGKLHS